MNKETADLCKRLRQLTGPYSTETEAAEKIEELYKAVGTGIRCMEQRNDALAEVERLTKLVDDIAYTAKNRKKKMRRYRDTLKSIGSWSQELQERAKETKCEGALWRGCVTEANAALERGGDAVKGRERIYPDGYFEKNRD